MTTMNPPATAAIPRRKAKRGLRSLPTLATLAAIIGLGWYGWNKTHPAADPNANLLTAKVTRGDLVESISATGSVTSQTGAQVKIGSQITGTIERLYADVGSQVKKDQLIAKLNLPDIEAQLDQSKANLAAAQTRLAQQQTGVPLQQAQTTTAIAQAQANLAAANARLRASQTRVAAAQAAARLQNAQTPSDIRRAETTLAAQKAALATAQSSLKQVQASADLQVANAQEAANGAKATANNASVNLKRQRALLDKGFVAASLVDAAEAQNTVAQTQATAALSSVSLVREQVLAGVQTARNQVTQAQQNVEAAHATLVAARAGTNTNAQRAADVANAKADVQDAQASVAQFQAALRAAQANTTQNALKGQDVQAAQEAVKQAQAQVDYQRAQLNKTFIRSPISGTVLQLASQQGETLAAGLSAPTLIIVADLNRLQVDALVDETDIGRVRLGQPTDITVDAFPKRVFHGKVSKIASGSTIQQGVVTYDVTIAIENAQHKLKPDMTANVTIQTGKKENVLLVASEAVKVGKRGATVNIMTNKEGKMEPSPVKVKTGASDGVSTEIVEGLKEGDTIVLAGMQDPRKQGNGPSSPFGPSGGGRGGGGGGRGGR